MAWKSFGGIGLDANSIGSSDGPTEIVATNGGTVNLGVAILGLDPNIGSVSLTAGDATTPGTIIASSLTINAHNISLNALRGAINVTGGLQARANGNFLLSDNHALGTFTVGAAANIFAAGLADFQGTVRAPTIIVTSGDLNIVTGASLGVTGITNLVAFNALSVGPMYIGDGLTPPPGAYALNEDGDIHARTMTINAHSPTNGTTPDIIIGDAHIDGSLTAGGGTTSIILGTNNGSIRIVGDVRWVNSGQSDNLTLNPGKAFEVNTDTGSIAMPTGSNALAGSLILECAQRVDRERFDPKPAREQSRTSPAATQRSAANSGTANPLGFVGAGTNQHFPSGTASSSRTAVPRLTWRHHRRRWRPVRSDSR